MQYTAQTAAKGWLSTSSIVTHHPQVIRKKKTGEGLVIYFQTANPQEILLVIEMCICYRSKHLQS